MGSLVYGLISQVQRVNDAIQKDLCSLKYTTVDQAVWQILCLGLGTLLAKIDI